MRIPTLLGLTILITACLLGVMFYLYKHDLNTQSVTDLSPQSIRYTNVTDNSITITWLSLQPVIGQISWGASQDLGNLSIDSRDVSQTTMRFTHTITLANLQEKTTYFFKIRNGPFFYPNQPLEFSTPTKLSLGIFNPIIGSSFETSQQPVTDALVFLETTGATPLSSYTSDNGNFVLPLATIRTTDLAKNFDLSATKSASLLIQTTSAQTRVKINIPTSKPLPPIILGQDQDLTK